MAGKDYLEAIRAELMLGRHQHRMGENVLRAFGYIRRRATAIEEINATLEMLGLVADPSVSSEMPLKSPRIRFSLKASPEAAMHEAFDDPTTLDSTGFDAPSQDPEDNDSNLAEPAFSVSELASAYCLVQCVPPGASIQAAYTTMTLYKYSQLVVAGHERPRQQDIKGVVSLQSMAKALMNGNPKIVGDCIDKEISFAQSDSDLKSVVHQLSGSDVVLVVGRDKRLQGHRPIVTAWDLAGEFAELVDPFKRIGEIEERLRTLLRKRLGNDKVAEFLRDHGLPGDDPAGELNELTMGELQRVLEVPVHWDALGLAFDRVVFIRALGDARDYRNRLMHFRDPLNEDEMTLLTNFCDMVREIQL